MNKFVTKYCLTSGIVIFEGETVKEGKYFSGIHEGVRFFLDSKDCFDSLNDAVKDAEIKREKKIKSLEKQINKLSIIRFDKDE